LIEVTGLCMFSGDVQWGVVRPHAAAENVKRRTSRQEERAWGHDAQGACSETELTQPGHAEWRHLVLQQVWSVRVGPVLCLITASVFVCDNSLLLQSLSSRVFFSSSSRSPLASDIGCQYSINQSINLYRAVVQRHVLIKEKCLKTDLKCVNGFEQFDSSVEESPRFSEQQQVDLHCALHRVATSSCHGNVDELATGPFLLLHREHGTGYWRSWNCCDQRTCFVVIWKHFCFILSTGTRIRTDSVMRPRFSSRGRNTSASVTVTVIISHACKTCWCTMLLAAHCPEKWLEDLSAK